MSGQSSHQTNAEKDVKVKVCRARWYCESCGGRRAKQFVEEEAVTTVGEVELASGEAVADGLYPSASSNGVEAIVSLRDNNVDCSVCRGQVAKEGLLEVECPALLPSRN